MAGLVGYDSSDEDENLQDEPQTQALQLPEENELIGPESAQGEASNGATAGPSPAPLPAYGPMMGPSRPPDEALLGPSLPPASLPPLDASTAPPNPSSSPASPYTAAQTLRRDLTLPRVPDLDIPPSPPGTPPPGLEALNAKFATFLDLKRRRGTHFNARLAGSAAARNPALMDKLLGFVGVETAAAGDDDAAASSEGKKAAAAQYATTLDRELWDPAGFPAWAFRGPLRRSQEVAGRERARGVGEPVEFVRSGPTSRSGTPGAGGGAPAAVTGKRKSRFDQP